MNSLWGMSGEELKEIFTRRLSVLPIAREDDFVQVVNLGSTALANVVGVNYRIGFSIKNTPNWRHINGIARSEEFKGRGLGRQVYWIAEGFMRDFGCSKIDLNASGHRVGVWKSLGFHFVAWLGDGQEAYMVKEIY